jgi:hypothetical protein
MVGLLSNEVFYYSNAFNCLFLNYLDGLGNKQAQ